MGSDVQVRSTTVPGRRGIVAAQAWVDVDASADRLWDLIVDVRRMGEWSPTCRGAKGADVLAAPVPGVTFRGVNASGRHRWRTTCTFVDVDPRREISWVVTNRGFSVSHWSYRIEELPTGATRLTETWRDLRHAPMLRFGPLVRAITGVRDVPAAIEGQLRATLAALRDAAVHEGAGAPASARPEGHAAADAPI